METQVKRKIYPQQRFILPEFRISYPHLLEPHRFKPKDPLKYSCVALIPKKTNLTIIQTAEKYARLSAYGREQSEWPEENFKILNDGDSANYKAKEGYPGHWVINLSSNENRKPDIISELKQPIVQAHELRAGYYAIAEVFCSAWQTPLGAGVKLSLNSLMRTRVGKTLGNFQSAESTFANIDVSEFTVDEFSDDVVAESEDFSSFM